MILSLVGNFVVQWNKELNFFVPHYLSDINIESHRSPFKLYKDKYGSNAVVVVVVVVVIMTVHFLEEKKLKIFLLGQM